MAGKSSDNPWAEMSRLNLESKEAKAPDPDSSRAMTAKAQEVVAAAAAKAQAADKADSDTGADLTADDLQAMSLKELQDLADEAGIDTEGLSKEDLIDALTSDEVALTAENQDDEEEILQDDSDELDTEDVDGEMTLEEALKLLGEDSDTGEDFSDAEFEVVEEDVQDGEVDNQTSNSNQLFDTFVSSLQIFREVNFDRK